MASSRCVNVKDGCLDSGSLLYFPLNYLYRCPDVHLINTGPCAAGALGAAALVPMAPLHHICSAHILFSNPEPASVSACARPVFVLFYLRTSGLGLGDKWRAAVRSLESMDVAGKSRPAFCVADSKRCSRAHSFAFLWRRTEGHAEDDCKSMEGAAEANQTAAQLDSQGSGHHQSGDTGY